MPKKSTKRGFKRKGKKGTRKQKPIVMVGCSRKNKKSCNNLKSESSCQNCGPNCHCGVNCKCPNPCPGNCYLNHRMKKQKGGKFGSGCGACECPLSPLSWPQMNKFGGSPNLQKLNPEYANIDKPVIQNTTGDFTSIPGINQNGGMCGSCASQGVQSGGEFYKPIGPMPGPFTGLAWKPDLGWPAMNGVGGDRNFLANYGGVIQNDPQQQMSMNDAGYKTPNSMVGGYRYNDKSPLSSKSSSKTYKKGGGLIPQDLVNLGRDFTYNFNSAYNSLNGYKAPVNPLPYKGQLTGALNYNKLML